MISVSEKTKFPTNGNFMYANKSDRKGMKRGLINDGIITKVEKSLNFFFSIAREFSQYL